MRIKDKAAANSTIFLGCRPRATMPAGVETQYWEDVLPQVARAVRKRVTKFQAAGIRGVDLYLASFGPALGSSPAFGQPSAARRKAHRDLFPEPRDPYEA